MVGAQWSDLDRSVRSGLRRPFYHWRTATRRADAPVSTQPCSAAWPRARRGAGRVLVERATVPAHSAPAARRGGGDEYHHRHALLTRARSHATVLDRPPCCGRPPRRRGADCDGACACGPRDPTGRLASTTPARDHDVCCCAIVVPGFGPRGTRTCRECVRALRPSGGCMLRRVVRATRCTAPTSAPGVQPGCSTLHLAHPGWGGAARDHADEWLVGAGVRGAPTTTHARVFPRTPAGSPARAQFSADRPQPHSTGQHRAGDRRARRDVDVAAPRRRRPDRRASPHPPAPGSGRRAPSAATELALVGSPSTASCSTESRPTRFA
jgi:hypothetical protein